MAARRVALLGAESTGKTRLANELATHLREQGCDAVAVPETLRAWCESAGRPPRPEEQLAIAQAQEAAVDAA
ncbi:MAG TPA: AAA family ATPase, partial [Ramlibacter sp.]|nr:AAA family ATPase [Ramlibacter sp.]